MLTPRQKEIAEAVKEHGSEVAAARALGVTRQTVHAAMRRVARKDPTLHADGAPEGYDLRGVSTLRRADGSTALQWVKTHQERPDPEAYARAVAAAIEACTAPRPPLPIAVGHSPTDLLSVLPIGDAHFGMLSWPEETGQRWDLKVAAEVHRRAVEDLLAMAPAADRTLVVWMGDAAHADDATGLTPASKHSLDTDSRWERSIGVLFAAMVNATELALRSSREVIVRVVKGNHDPHVAAALALALEAYYRLEPRVTVDRAPTPLYVYVHGRVLLAFTHGHAPKPERVPGILMADYRRELGATEHGYLYTGHVHSKQLREVGGLQMESVQVLSARDAYATHAGFRSGRSIFVDTFHAEKLAPIERHTIAAQDLEDK